MEKLRLAVVGAGARGQVHAKAWNAEGGIVRAVSDVDASRADEMASTYGAEHEPDWESMMRRDDVDVVSVCVPAAFHAPVALAALRAGKHVLCE